MKDNDIRKNIELKIEQLQGNSLVGQPSNILKCIDECSALLMSIENTNNRLDIENFIVKELSQLTVFVLDKISNAQKKMISDDIPNDNSEYINVYRNIFTKLDTFSINKDTDLFYQEKKRKFETISKQMDSRGGCYIATMAYGDYDHPQVVELRKFRDDFLSKTIIGRGFIKFYYKYSPSWVEKLKNRQNINLIIRKGLDQFIKAIKK